MSEQLIFFASGSSSSYLIISQHSLSPGNSSSTSMGDSGTLIFLRGGRTASGGEPGTTPGGKGLGVGRGREATLAALRGEELRSRMGGGNNSWGTQAGWGPIYVQRGVGPLNSINVLCSPRWQLMSRRYSRATLRSKQAICGQPKKKYCLVKNLDCLPESVCNPRLSPTARDTIPQSCDELYKLDRTSMSEGTRTASVTYDHTY